MYAFARHFIVDTFVGFHIPSLGLVLGNKALVWSSLFTHSFLVLTDSLFVNLSDEQNGGSAVLACLLRRTDGG